MLRVLVIDESAERADTLRDGLARAGHEVVATWSRRGAGLRHRRGRRHHHRDRLAVARRARAAGLVSRDGAAPVVMFAEDAPPETIRAVTRPAYPAYIVDGSRPGRVPRSCARRANGSTPTSDCARSSRDARRARRAQGRRAREGNPDEAARARRGGRLRRVAPPGDGPRQSPGRGRHGSHGRRRAAQRVRPART